jgi:hypothetical protein
VQKPHEWHRLRKRFLQRMQPSVLVHPSSVQQTCLNIIYFQQQERTGFIPQDGANAAITYLHPAFPLLGAASEENRETLGLHPHFQTMVHRST